MSRVELQALLPFESDSGEPHQHTWSTLFILKHRASPIWCCTCGLRLTDAQAEALLDGGDPFQGETVEMSREEILRLLQDELQL